MSDAEGIKNIFDTLDKVIESPEDADELEILLRIKKLTPEKRRILLEGLKLYGESRSQP